MKPKPDIVFLDASTVDLGDIDLNALDRLGRYRPLRLTTTDPLPPEAERAEVLITNKFYLGESEFAKLNRLRLVCIAATGTNNVDLNAARKRGIAVTNAVGYSTTAVVEHTMLFLLSFAHRLFPNYDSVIKGEWSHSPHFALLQFPYRELKGKVLGIIGYGTIGRQVARIAKIFGMKILVAKIPGRRYAKNEERLSLPDVLRKSDYVSLHCALTSVTEGLINRERLKMMKRGAFLLNLARGSVVVEADIASALKKGHLSGYASDVLGREPPPHNHILCHSSFRNRVILTPHIAWASVEARQRLILEIAKNIAAFLRGRRRHRIV